MESIIHKNIISQGKKLFKINLSKLIHTPPHPGLKNSTLRSAPANLATITFMHLFHFVDNTLNPFTTVQKENVINRGAQLLKKTDVYSPQIMTII